MAESANYLDKNEFSLIVDDVSSEIPIKDLSFTLYDSIYSLYSKAKVSLNDTSGYYGEYLGFTNGTKIKLSYGQNKESLKSCTYRVVDNSTPEQNNNERWGGNIELSLIHDYYHNQTKTCKGYDENISDIISKLAGKYKFESKDIDTTLNNGKWYQTYLTDADFMVNRLLPFCYSTDSSKSPFFLFIDSNNVFHLKSFARMMTQNPVTTLRWKQKGTDESCKQDTILSISMAQAKTSETIDTYHRMFYTFDKKGEFKKNSQDSYLKNYPSSEQYPIPIKFNMNNLTDVVGLYDEDIKLEETKNNNLGLEINSVRNAISMDKIIITIPLNRNICAGQIVTVDLPSASDKIDSNKQSLRYSGNYLVESSYQNWNGKDSSTTLVCSKQIVKVTNYRNVALIVNR